jgi:acetyltransferase
VTLRPIRPEDEPAMAEFHRTLSAESVYFRYLHPLTLAHRLSHERLSRICFVDYDRQMVLVAERVGEDGRQILGVGRLSRIPWTDEAEFALLVSDAFHGRGLGTELLQRLLDVAGIERIRRVVGYISPENTAMLDVAKRLGFRARRPKDDPTLMEVTREIAAPSS